MMQLEREQLDKKSITEISFHNTISIAVRLSESVSSSNFPGGHL